jgi:hypothetical protein
MGATPAPAPEKDRTIIALLIDFSDPRKIFHANARKTHGLPAPEKILPAAVIPREQALEMSPEKNRPMEYPELSVYYFR